MLPASRMAALTAVPSRSAGVNPMYPHDTPLPSLAVSVGVLISSVAVLASVIPNDGGDEINSNHKGRIKY